MSRRGMDIAFKFAMESIVSYVAFLLFKQLYTENKIAFIFCIAFFLNATLLTLINVAFVIIDIEKTKERERKRNVIRKKSLA